MNESYGLLSSMSGPIPLTGVKVRGDILGRGAKINIFQRFTNQEDKAIEAVYKFPLPEGAAVCGFNAVIDGKKIHGHVEERNKAFEIYDDALANGNGGYLLDEERPNIFTLSVGNLNPNAEVMVEIEYVTLLGMEEREVRFFLPTTISPRYSKFIRNQSSPLRDGFFSSETSFLKPVNKVIDSFYESRYIYLDSRPFFYFMHNRKR
ncbi:hypothetical protein PITCH_A350011 [uncultured Desulfobacterium sp.]|uniref:VIT domain-containing protein n=1 Tax=uncultured Desulfobacterium sp. TaxID=201089 RepID=A0A445MZK6_9BACT|nr:hypothetical protein PITCH_A350011 [uncultured Desulfobacterium sp.]